MRFKLNIYKFFIIFIVICQFIIFIAGCDQRSENDLFVERRIEYAKDDETKICFVYSQFDHNYFEVVPCSKEIEDKIRKSNAKK